MLEVVDTICSVDSILEIIMTNHLVALITLLCNKGSGTDHHFGKLAFIVTLTLYPCFLCNVIAQLLKIICAEYKLSINLSVVDILLSLKMLSKW